MSKPVEQYEQALAADPNSTVYVDLVRAYLERGENDKAVGVCQKSCAVHTKSVVGRVLWGKALLHAGRAAEAMQQFDAAVAIDKDNPHAYNLISEVLLKKGLYRSALPMLRKASALQAGDARVTKLLEDAKAALAGGAPPVLDDLNATEVGELDEAGRPRAATTLQSMPAVAAPAPAPAPAPVAKPAPAPAPAPAPVAKPAPAPAPAPAPVAKPAGASSAALPPVQAKPAAPPAAAPAAKASSPKPHGATVPAPPPTPTRPLTPVVAPAMATQPLPSLASLMAPNATQPLPSLQELGLAVKPPSPSTPAADPDVFAAFGSAPPPEESTQLMNAYLGGSDVEVPTQNIIIPAAVTAGPSTLELPLAQGEPPRVTTELPIATGELPFPNIDVGARPTLEVQVPNVNRPAPPVLDPFDALVPSKPLEENDVMVGLTSTFDAIAQGTAGQAALPVVGVGVPRSAPRSAPPVLEAAPTPAGEPAELSTGDVIPLSGQVKLLDDVASAQNEIPTSELRLPANASIPDLGLGMRPKAPAPSASSTSGRAPLLEDLPDVPSLEPAPAAEPPKVEFSTQATEAIAREYEKELRAKLEATTTKKTFLQKHGVKLAAAGLLLVIGGGLGGSFLYTRVQNKGENLTSSLSKGALAIGADTKEQYEEAIKLLRAAQKMDSKNVEAAAGEAYAHAVLFSEHGGKPEEKAAARALLDKPGVRDERANLALLADFLTAEPAAIVGLRQKLLAAPTQDDAATPNRGELHAEAGRVLLADKQYEDAFKHLKAAVDANSKSVRALVALGDYYLAFQDYENAEQLFGGAAEQLSKFHPARVIGLAQARLELAHDAATALSELESLPNNASIPDGLKGRYALVLGRAQSANAKHEAALATLTKGQAASPEAAYDFTMALGQAHRAAGRMDKAQAAFEEAMKLDPKSEDAKEGLGRVLLARSREKDLLERLKPDTEARRVALVRGIAYVRLNDAKRARAELLRTKIKDKYPAEAAVYLSLADAQEEQGDKVVKSLEDLLTRTKKQRATVQVALARVLMQKNAYDKARPLLEEAAKDPTDYEGSALLGELLLNVGAPVDLSIEALQRSVDHNGSHAPARHLLTRTLLALGRWPEAQKQVDAWTVDNPTSELAAKDAALVYLQTGRSKDAEVAVNNGVKDSSADVEAFRLRAQVLFARGDSRGAFASLERANKLNPKDAETFCEIGNAFVRQGNADTALEAYKAALREDPKAFCGKVGPHFAKPAARGVGKVTPREELAELAKVAASAWDRAFAQAALSRVMLEERDFKRALEVAIEATQSVPGSAPAFFALAEVSKRQKNDQQYLEALSKAAELDQAWSTVRLALGDEYAKDPAKAAAAVTEYEAVVATSQNDGDIAKAKKQLAVLGKAKR